MPEILSEWPATMFNRPGTIARYLRAPLTRSFVAAASSSTTLWPWAILHPSVLFTST